MSGFVSQIDLRLIISENYITFLLLGGLLVVMYAYRDIHLPAAGNFLLIILVLFLMSVSNSMERWAMLSPDRRGMRIAMSVLHYCLQPCVIWLELVIIMPQADRKRRLKMFLLSIPLIWNTIVYLSAPYAGKLVFWYGKGYTFSRGPLGYSIYVVTFFYLLLLLDWSFRFLRQNDRRKAIILLFLIFSGLLTGILEGMNLITGYIDEAFAFGVFLYYMYLVTVHELEMQTSLAKKELELSENRVKLLQEQIRPHFIFNSLHIIKSLIRTDQKKAIQCVEDFSDYLRANLEVMTSDKLILFDDELDHIRAFVSIALSDESKGITVKYDIHERYFRVPPLTIEPLVENALQHGVTNGGTVVLSTCLDDDTYLITVSDDGRGMEQARTEKAKKRDGISLENVRSRLAVLCSGTLEMESSDQGTVVSVRIPRETRKGAADPGLQTGLKQ